MQNRSKYFTNNGNAHIVLTQRCPVQNNPVLKRTVNPKFNEGLVIQEKEMTNNPSGVSEQPLTDDVLKQNNARQEKLHNADAAAQGWNTFNEQSGSFADEYSTL